MYGIVDPTTCLFVYVGQSGRFEDRKAEHLNPPRTHKTKYRPDDIKGWLAGAYAAKIKPQFINLDTVETEEQSILSEKRWVKKLADIGRPVDDAPAVAKPWPSPSP